MSRAFSRRGFLLGSLAAAGYFGFPRPGRAAGKVSLQVEQIDTISHQRHNYHGWPTLARRKNGELLLVYSGGREAHVCPFGRVELMRSKDQGQSWSWPRVLLDSPIDDRDSGVLETAKGTLLVTTFTSLAFEDFMARARFTRETYLRWSAARDRISPLQRKQELGVWMLRSTDGGVTWSARYDAQVNSPHGPIQLSDGRLLYAGKDLWRHRDRVEVCISQDDGRSWHRQAVIPPRDGDRARNYHELHAVETADGRIVCHIRNHNPKNYRETLQCESADGGRTWSKPRAIGVWGLPSHLLRLRDDTLLMSYGHRRKPFGVQARISRDHGRTWSEPLVIYDQGTGGDLGYPSTVELDDGSLLTVWYELRAGHPKAQLRQARWKLLR